MIKSTTFVSFSVTFVTFSGNFSLKSGELVEDIGLIQNISFLETYPPSAKYLPSLGTYKK